MYNIYKLKYLSILFIAAVLSGCAASTQTSIDQKFEDAKLKIHRQFSDPRFEHAFWGVLIKSLKTGEIWYERNADKLFMPASNEKIPTTAAALIKLGPEFTFKTELYYDGFIEGNTLDGDLIVVGEGDPTLYTRFYDTPKDVFKKWARILNEKGVQIISGRIIGDDNAFDDNRIGYGWAFNNLDTWYSAEIDALQINENYIDLKIVPPSSSNEEIKIEPNINSKYFKLTNNLNAVESGSSNIWTSREYGTNNIVLNGTVLIGDKPIERSPSITNPCLFYVTVLKETLEEEGIKVMGNPTDCDDIPGWTRQQTDLILIDLHLSPPLKEILKNLMKPSQNLYAETMTKTLGWKFKGEGSFRQGKKVVEEVLKSFGIEPESYAYMDGSGLSRYNYISPRQITAILEGMLNSPYKTEWLETFPIAGVDGTLRNRMKNTSAEGNVRAKTGTISNVRGLSGYAATADGEEIVFSFLVNAHLRSTKETEEITDSVLEIITSLDRIEILSISNK
jgi:D-alanyl-D-alanine carboxypeptidase/D-alanyl-D-alanine-endopeptidase (penicillin-binding protein 4)